MTLAVRRIVAAILALLLALPLAQARAAYTQAELDQMLAPIALYPDPLLSQVLMAATYPLEVAEAARWSRRNPRLKGDDAVRAVQDRDWDPSVKSLVAFPNVLARMDENIEWTRKLGDAFLEQEPQVMDAVQELRHRARAAGNLAPDERYRVVEDGRAIVIEPAQPQIVYVPYYDPWVVYGPWWWPAYPPVVWAPWPGYARPYYPGVTVGFWWGAPVGLSVGFFFGNVDWYYRHVRVVHTNVHYYRHHYDARGFAPRAPGRWEHDPSHRRGVAYRDPAVQQRFTAAPQAPSQPREIRTETRRETVRQTERRATERQRRTEERRREVVRPESRPQMQLQETRPQAQPRVQAPEAQPRPQPRAPEAQPRPQPQPRAPEVRAQPRPQPRAPEVRGQPQPRAPEVRAQPQPRTPEARPPQRQENAGNRSPQRAERRERPSDSRAERGRPPRGNDRS